MGVRSTISTDSKSGFGTVTRTSRLSRQARKRRTWSTAATDQPQMKTFLSDFLRCAIRSPIFRPRSGWFTLVWYTAHTIPVHDEHYVESASQASSLLTCCHCQGVAQLFDEKMARRQLRHYRRKGPGKGTRQLIDAVAEGGVEGRTFIDIGGGIGAIQHDLMDRGAVGGTSADASPAYLAAARTEAEARGFVWPGPVCGG